jgi:hypothetical protein
MSGGTFVVNRQSVGAIIDSACQVRSITFVSPVSVIEPVGYDPVTTLPSSGTFCIADADGYDNFNWNFDVQGNGGMPRNTAITITPANPPSVKVISRLICLSCPQGASFSITTVAAP